MQTQPKFIERWFSKAKEERLLEAFANAEGDGEIVEVGSWEGRSTIALANTCFPAKVHAIDHWKGDLGDDKSQVAKLAASRDVYSAFEHNMQVATKGNYIVHRMSWREVNWQLFGSIRFLFIDGEHTYPEVFDNITIALPLMCAGGVIAGDDFNVPGVKKAVLAKFGDVNCSVGAKSSVWYKKIAREHNK